MRVSVATLLIAVMVLAVMLKLNTAVRRTQTMPYLPPGVVSSKGAPDFKQMVIAVHYDKG